MAELKPCPFCGHSAALESVGVDHFVMCDGCCAESARWQSPTGDAESAKRRAVESWNLRASPSDKQRGELTVEDIWRIWREPEGWRLAPVEPTPEIMAGAALAVLRPASKADLVLARAAARIVLERAAAVPPGLTADMLAASIATMAPAYRAMLAAAPTPPAGDAGQERDRRDAERYLHVRAHGMPKLCPAGFYYHDGVFYPTADAAIDAVIKTNKENI